MRIDCSFKKNFEFAKSVENVPERNNWMTLCYSSWDGGLGVCTVPYFITRIFKLNAMNKCFNKSLNALLDCYISCYFVFEESVRH